MRPLLLDTHVWLWMLVNPSRLPNDLVERLSSTSEVVFSTASAWEISIKYALGKIPLPAPPKAFIGPRLIRDKIRLLTIELRHTVEVAELPPHHSDPFDRLLVAQAREEKMCLVTADGILEKYDVEIWKV